MKYQRDLSDWLFLFPDVRSVHERMELEWTLANNQQPSAICRYSEAELAAPYFQRLFIIEDFMPSKRRLFWETTRFLFTEASTFTTIPLSQWKLALGYIKDEVRIGVAIDSCARQQGFQNFYSFWAFNPVRNQILKTLNKHTHSITRAHGGDIYHHSDYIGQGHIWPWRKKALRTYDQILSVSIEGTEYLTSRHGLSNVRTVYLGSRIPQKMKSSSEKNSGDIKFVSVANIIPLKRLERIALILKELETPIEWNHFGEARSGEFEQNLKSHIRSLLSNTPHKVIWHGRKKPEEIFQFYQKEHPQLFLSCSESEGIPVSIMEAMSCGIPVFTTDAGGSHELVKGNGICVPIEFDAANVAIWIEENIFNPQLLRGMRRESVKHWESRFCFDTNQDEWLQTLLKFETIPLQ